MKNEATASRDPARDGLTPATGDSSRTGPADDKEDGKARPHERYRPPATGDDIISSAEISYGVVYWRAEKHDVLARRWEFVDSWSRLVVALAASLSALSMFADNELLTAAFAVTTAVVSALNAAWEPSRRATRHRRAAKEYGKCVGTIYDFITVVGSRARHYVPEAAYDTGTDRYYDAGRWIGHDLSDEELQDFWSQFLTYKDEIEAIEANAPSMGRLFAENMDAGPQTRFGLWRMERYLRLQKKAAEVRRAYSQFVDPPTEPPPGGPAPRWPH